MAAPLEEDDEGEMKGEQPPRRAADHQEQAPEETYLNDDDLLGIPPVDGEPRQQDEDSLAERQETLLDQRRDHEHKRDRRERQKAARDRSQQELKVLRDTVARLQEQVADVHPRLAEVDIDRQRARIADAERAIEYHAQRVKAAQQAMSSAVVSGDAEALNNALNVRDEAFISRQQAMAQKQAMLQSMPQQAQDQGPRQPAPAPIPRAIQQRIEAFQQDFDWYNPRDPRDLDSKIVLQLDNAIAAEGYEPGTDDYWDELRDRMARYLPHRFERERQSQQQQQQPRQQQAAPQNRRGPMAAAPSERPAPKQQSAVAPELAKGRKDALVAAGVIDRDGRIYNQVKYDSYVKQFKKYDRENSGAVR